MKEILVPLAPMIPILITYGILGVYLLLLRCLSAGCTRDSALF